MPSIPPQMASLLLSTLATALGNCGSRLLALVPTGRLKDHLYLGSSGLGATVVRCRVENRQVSADQRQLQVIDQMRRCLSLRFLRHSAKG